MSDGIRGEVARHIRALFSAGTTAGLTDGQLLERFASRRDEAAELAFSALVERHGPTVLRVCRGVLRDPHDAEDAFQATFLVLARRAGSIRRRDSVGSWLYGVALRVSADARELAARRRSHERRAAEMSARSVGDVGHDDIRSVVHEEVGRLPERYRAAVVLCDLQGQTCEDAARLLGWPVGTVKSRLARARDRLRGRLALRGLAPMTFPAGGLPLAARWPQGPIDVPPELAEATVRAALTCSASRAAAAGAIPATVAALTEGALNTMLLAKLKSAAAAAAMIGVALAGTSVLARHSPDRRPDAGQSSSTARPVASDDAATPARGGQVADLQGAVSPGLLASADRASTADPFAGRSDVESRGPSIQELEILIAQAKRRLARQERQSQRGTVPHEVLEDAKDEVEILKARLENRLSDLRDELERLEARLRVKELEVKDASDRANQRGFGGRGELMGPPDRRQELAVKVAETEEVKIRIMQVRRRLEKAQPRGPATEDPAPASSTPPRQ